jgi:hypothetical protein
MIGLVVVLALVVAGVVVRLLSKTPMWWAPGAAALTGALALFADMGGQEACHDGALCGLDAIGRFIEGAFGAALVVLGAIMLALASGMHRRHVARRAEIAAALPRAIVR